MPEQGAVCYQRGTAGKARRHNHSLLIGLSARSLEHKTQPDTQTETRSVLGKSTQNVWDCVENRAQIEMTGVLIFSVAQRSSNRLLAAEQTRSGLNNFKSLPQVALCVCVLNTCTSVFFPSQYVDNMSMCICFSILVAQTSSTSPQKDFFDSVTCATEW